MMELALLLFAKAWDAYSKTVADGTFFGGYITGAGGALPQLPCCCSCWM